jgi:DNA mismatch repair protein MutS
VKSGAANKSYGLQVALLAGVPRNVVAQARLRLKQLEDQAATMQPQQSRLNFGAPPPVLDVVEIAPEAVNPVLAQLAKLDVEDISPKQALALIYEWKALLK